jgi:hypothetical protein
MNLSCTSSVLVCSNSLDAGAFGFTMTVPDAFACAYSAAVWGVRPPAAAVVIWTDKDSQALLSLTVFDLSQGNVPDLPGELNYTALDNHETAALTFTLTRGENPDGSGSGGAFYVAQADLPGGAYAIRISLLVEQASDAALATLRTVLDGVVLSGG